MPVSRLKILLIATALLYSSRTNVSAAIIFESGTLGPTEIPWSDLIDKTVPGENIKTNAFLGVRFQVTQPATTTRVGGHFASHTNGSFFGALIALDDESDFPDSDVLSSPDVLGTTTLSFPSPSDEVFGNITLALAPGWYALVFGSGLFAASGEGGAPLNNPDIGTPNYIGFLDGVGWGNRLPNKRFVVEGFIIPEPSSLALVSVAGVILLFRSVYYCH